jgi:hypothetical protein
LPAAEQAEFAAGQQTYHGIDATLLMRSIQNFHPMNPEAD